jgi:hypothetical protein
MWRSDLRIDHIVVTKDMSYVKTPGTFRVNRDSSWIEMSWETST